MKIEQLMTKSIVSVRMDDMLSQVKSLFESHKFHHLLVVENAKLVGVLSDRDLFKALSPNIGSGSETAKDKASLNKRVHQVMGRNLVTLTPTCSLFKAIKLFNQTSVSCIPVVDNMMSPVGILSWRDVFKHIELNQLQKQQNKAS